MLKFGQYAVVFNGELFVSRVTDALSQFHCNLAYHGIEYCNKADHASMRARIKELQPTLGGTTIYFIKDQDYQTQHEWRYIIDYFRFNIKFFLFFACFNKFNSEVSFVFFC